MGSDMALDPPRPVFEWETYENEDDALLAVAVAWENGWRVEGYFYAEGYRVGIHKGAYI